jgi:hypothetical protein
VLILAAAVLVTAAGCGSIETYAAKVNGEAISEEELQSELEAILDNQAYVTQIEENFQGPEGQGALGAGNKTFTTAFVAALLDRQISFELIEQEVRRRNITVTDADRRSATEDLDQTFGPEVVAAFPASYTDRLVEDFARVAALERALTGTGVSDEEVRRFYESNAALFRQQSCSRHILVPTLEAASAIRARIDAGEDFAAIARAESTDRGGQGGGSAAQGGDLGCQPRNTFVPEFQAALDALTPGQVSAPVQTQFGFHVIQLVERRDVPLEEAAPLIRRQLEQQAAGQGAVARFVNDAVGDAEITVNPRYGSFEKGDTPGVRPPPGVGGPPVTAEVPLPLQPPPAP